MVDMYAWGAYAERCGGSSPPSGTIQYKQSSTISRRFFCCKMHWKRGDLNRRKNINCSWYFLWESRMRRRAFKSPLGHHLKIKKDSSSDGSFYSSNSVERGLNRWKNHLFLIERKSTENSLDILDNCFTKNFYCSRWIYMTSISYTIEPGVLICAFEKESIRSLSWECKSLRKSIKYFKNLTLIRIQYGVIHHKKSIFDISYCYPSLQMIESF